GDDRHVWMEVHARRGRVGLLGAEDGKGQKGGQVTVRWRAADKNLGPGPVTLSFAAQPDGPWQPLATGLENTGHYAGGLPPDAPPRLFVRVEAVDLAGNGGSVVTAHALGDAAAPPPAAILTVEAIEP